MQAKRRYEGIGPGRCGAWPGRVSIAGMAIVAGLTLLMTGVPARAAEAPRHRIYLPILSPQPQTVLAPSFSRPHGLYAAPFVLTLRTGTPDASIRFTTDGSRPDETQGLPYTGPLLIEDTTVLRAVAFRRGMRTSPVVTASYLFPERVLRQPDQPDPGRFPPFWGYYQEGYDPGMPVLSDYGMDPDVVDDPRSAGRIASDLRALPSVSLVLDPIDLFGIPGRFGDSPGIYSHPLEEGADWERPASAELILGDGRPGFQVDAGVRIAGGWSRKPDVTPKHSFSLHFRSRYGSARLRYPLFPGSTADSFDSLRLRASQADSFAYLPRSLYVHDEWGRRTQLAMGSPAARGRYVHLYLNGLYWGLYNLAEEPTAGFAAEHLGGEAAEWDVVKGREVTEIRHGKPVALPDWELEDGDPAAFEALLAIPRAGPATDPGLMARMQALLDLDQHIDYTLLEIYTANDDWLTKNWRAMRRRLPGERWRILVWDIERTVFLRAIDPRCGDGDYTHCDVWQAGEKLVPVVGDVSTTPGVMGLHGWLSGSPDYRLRFADRARRLFFEAGLLTPAAVRARYAALLDEVEPGIEGESARWGDAIPRSRSRNENFTPWSLFWSVTPDRTLRRDPQWLGERARLLDQAIPIRTGIVLEQLCRAGLFPPVAPLRARLEGDPYAAGGARLVIERLSGGCPGALDAGTILYTLDGSDPRQPGSSPVGTWWTGTVSPTAREYARPLALAGYAHLRARLAVPDAGGLLWGPEVELQVGQPRMAISELRYHPPAGAAEFLELRSLEPAPIDLSGASFEGITLTLPYGTLVPPDGYLVVSSDAARFVAEHPGVPLAGEYLGGLSNAGERIALRDAQGRVLAALDYDDGGFWPRGADLLGHSLVPREGAVEGAEQPEAWRESALPGGSPGAEDPAPPWPRILPNELLANSAAPYEDAIELYNPGLAPADVSGWWLSDDDATLDKYRFPPGSIVPPGGYRAVYEPELRSGGDGGAGGFALSSAGESVLLTAVGPAGRPLGFVRGLDFGPTATNVSLGRHTNSVGLLELVPQARPSFGVDQPADPTAFREGRGAANAGPRIGPVVIAEIMAAPAAGAQEWVELHNAGDATAYLFDPADRARSWAFIDGIDFRFPPGAFIPAGGRLLVVSGDPRAFRAEHRLPNAVPIFGPFGGRLDNRGERLTLAMPFERDAADGSPLWVELERLTWDDAGHWPALAAGAGASLERREPAGYANDPVSWLGLRLGGTPGSTNTVPTILHLPWMAR